ncbi:MAG: hypothetical protein V1662_05430 [Candidatus Omnitrophota bacterium]
MKKSIKVIWIIFLLLLFCEYTPTLQTNALAADASAVSSGWQEIPAYGTELDAIRNWQSAVPGLIPQQVTTITGDPSQGEAAEYQRYGGFTELGTVQRSSAKPFDNSPQGDTPLGGGVAIDLPTQGSPTDAVEGDSAFNLTVKSKSNVEDSKFNYVGTFDDGTRFIGGENGFGAPPAAAPSFGNNGYLEYTADMNLDENGIGTMTVQANCSGMPVNIEVPIFAPGMTQSLKNGLQQVSGAK